MPAPSADKVIVTHKASLSAKYKPAGLKKIETALGKLIAEDAKRGLHAIVVDLSSTADANKDGFTVVPLGMVANAKLHKQAIDKIYAFHKQPAYLMLLGATDVIPHVPLKNPLHVADANGDFDDPDATADSDLPYACEAAYSLDARKFIAPTRTVGRLPDVVGGSQEDYVVGLIEIAAGYRERPRANYDSYLGLSAKVWQKSTEDSLDAVFGSHADLQLSPPVDFPAAAAQHLNKLAHFINCHGSDGVPRFFGQDKFGYPTALDAAQLKGKVKEGTVVAAECCYGAQLYDPKVKLEPMGLCNTYLQESAYGFFGSSTIAYGPAEGNEFADLICQFFLKHVREGASLGRACLQARLDYAKSLNGTITASDLKTLAQFNLLGDPAITPVPAISPPAVVKTIGIAKPAAKGLAGDAAAAVAQFVVDRFTRDGRREWLRTYSGLLASVASCVTDALVDVALTQAAKGNKMPGKTNAGDRDVGQRLRELAKEMKMDDPTVMLFGMEGAPGIGGPKNIAKSLGKSKAVGMKAPERSVQRVHVVMERTESDKDQKTVHIRGFEAIESEGMLKVRKFVSR